jgi:hypothetical protein
MDVITDPTDPTGIAGPTGTSGCAVKVPEVIGAYAPFTVRSDPAKPGRGDATCFHPVW